MLDQVGLDALAASSAASALSPTSTLSQISLKGKKHALTLTPGVYNLTNFQLTHTSLTLSGSGSFVFNISSSFALKFGQVLLTGGATESDVLFNYTGTSDISLSGGKKSGSVLHGIILALNANVNLTQGLVVGEIISGHNITIGSGSAIQGLPNVAPPFKDPGGQQVPDQTSTIVLSFIALAMVAAFRAFLVRNFPALSSNG
jgi:choice-of-anchor A domain-containing protein